MPHSQQKHTYKITNIHKIRSKLMEMEWKEYHISPQIENS